MKRIAKITVALLLAVAMCFSLAGCYDEDLNWSAKYDDTELPAGAYIYYLSIAYNEAASKVSTEDEVLKSEIDGTPAETWIKNRADEYVNQYFYIQNEMKRLGLEMIFTQGTLAGVLPQGVPFLIMQKKFVCQSRMLRYGTGPDTDKARAPMSFEAGLCNCRTADGDQQAQDDQHFVKRSHLFSCHIL